MNPTLSSNFLEIFYEEIKNGEKTYYAFIGNTDDNSLNIENNTFHQIEKEIYKTILYGKKIKSADVEFLTKRYDWTANTIYDVYDQDDQFLHKKKFYVLTSDNDDIFHVFKCIDNANNSPSTVKPIFAYTKGTFKTADGYTWKYMYTIPVSANSKFTSNSYIPIIANAEVKENAIPGTIDVIRIANEGHSYLYEKGTFPLVVSNTEIKLPNTSSSLNGHYVGNSIYIKQGYSQGQVRKIINYDGLTKTATLDSSIIRYIKVDFENSTTITNSNPGVILTQRIENISYLNSVGFLGGESTFIQSDNSLAGTRISSNTSVVRLRRLNNSLSFENGIPLRGSSDLGSSIPERVNVTTNTELFTTLIENPGSGYTANANVSITATLGIGGAANSVANSSGKISTVNITANGTGYVFEPTVTVSLPVAQSFNANTSVTGGIGMGSNNVIELSTANKFQAGDKIFYYVESGNTVITGLSNNTMYFVQFANATHVALSNTFSLSTRIEIQKGSSETGHYLRGERAKVRIIPKGCVVTNATPSANLANSFANGSFIRVGENANSNIRYVNFANSTTLFVNRVFANNLTSANTYKQSVAFLPSNVDFSVAEGVIETNNISTLKLDVSNTTLSDENFSVGEKIELISQSNNYLNAFGTLVYSNSSVVYLSGVSGTFLAGQYIRGINSTKKSKIEKVTSSHNVILKNTTGNFVINELADFRLNSSNTGLAKIVDINNLTDYNVDYEIGPSINVEGDGENFIGFVRVNSNNNINSISEILVLNPGKNYTTANVTVSGNTLYGTNAIVTPVISPLKGHGYDAKRELGERRLGISVEFKMFEDENWYFSSEISYNQFGIIKDPLYKKVFLYTTDYDVRKLGIQNTTGTWTNNEIVYQQTTNATGVLVSGNSSVIKLKDVRGNFNVSNTIIGLTSLATANVSTIETIKFDDGEIIEQESTGAEAKIITSAANNMLTITDVKGNLIANSHITGKTNKAKCKITSIFLDNQAKDLSAFGEKFSELTRLSLFTVSGNFQDGEIVTQSTTNAKAKVLKVNSDLDLIINNVSGSFSVGNLIYNSNTNANALCIFANTSYLKLSVVSNTAAFFANNLINNGLSANAKIQEVRKVITVYDVKGDFIQSFSTTHLLKGKTSNAEAFVALTPTKTDLVKNSGIAIYIENLNNSLEKSLNTSEKLTFTIKI